MTATATLLWRAAGGAAPQPFDFDEFGVGFPTYEEALRAAHVEQPAHAPREPWIRVGDALFSPEEVMVANTPPPPLGREK